MLNAFHALRYPKRERRDAQHIAAACRVAPRRCRENRACLVAVSGCPLLRLPRGAPGKKPSDARTCTRHRLHILF